LIDGGFRTGADLAVALARGADAVMIGRPYLYGLMAGGEAGVRRALEIFDSGLRDTMRHLGAGTIAELSPAAPGR
jgi:L-lactate dehydrogenase (cytochrome)